MRKAIVYILAALFMMLVPLSSAAADPYIFFPTDSPACVYINGASDYEGTKTVMSGGEILYMPLKDAAVYDNAAGISVKIENKQLQDIDRLIVRLRINVSGREDAGGIIIVTGYSKYFDRCLIVGGRRINVQIAFNKGTLTLGTPLILGSY